VRIGCVRFKKDYFRELLMSVSRRGFLGGLAASLSAINLSLGSNRPEEPEPCSDCGVTRGMEDEPCSDCQYLSCPDNHCLFVTKQES
jgi:hypothetical protein